MKTDLDYLIKAINDLEKDPIIRTEEGKLIVQVIKNIVIRALNKQTDDELNKIKSNV